ncbi:hypothetical protein L3X38_037266 [Prunus dulcis]|uniref:Uncharacterized protein n=1 Tax=Prunus dulcis TaxID=3755 RepID=A0AAD4YQI3_PRUDU|nr:hypothetical protein L3X38_037266 [Prunus dulcis]
MHVWCIVRLIPGIPGHITRYRSTPLPNQSHSRDEVAFHSEGNTKPDGQSSDSQPIPLEINRQIQTILQSLEERTKRQWDEECEVALQNLKTYLNSPPLLSKLVPGEDLFVCLAVSNSVVSSALIREELGA